MATSSLESQSLKRISPKIEITCQGCSARYRVPSEKAGKRVRCRKCKAKIEVPARDISIRTRRVILEELGITHDDQPAYTPGGDDVDLAALYGMDADDGAEAGETDAEGNPKKKKKELKTWVRKEDPSKAKTKAIATSGLVLFGGLGFARSVLFLGWIGAVITAVVLAAVTYKVAIQAYAQSEHPPLST